jgi:uncharacterized membrane protein YfcA
MEIYLPIAEMSVNIIGILLLGIMTGILSGMFGVGGGFLTTPLLMFIGIPPAVAVASSANQIVASSTTGFLAHWRRDNIDFKMGFLLLEGGIVGSCAGVWLFAILKKYGQIDLTISLLYVTMLGSIGAIMAMESYRSLYKVQEQQIMPTVVMRFPFLSRLPMVREFPRSKLQLSALLPLGIGFTSGLLVSLLGVGGGFLMIPAMIYILGMPTSIVIGTSLFQIIFITANVTFLQAVTTHTVDIVLAILLIFGSVVGAQIGTRIGSRLPAAKLRGMLAVIVLSVALKLAWDLFAKPHDIYSIAVMSNT